MSTAEVGAAVSADVAPLGAAAGVLEGAGVDVRPAGSVGVTGGTGVSVVAATWAGAPMVTVPPVSVLAIVLDSDVPLRLDPPRLIAVDPGDFAWKTALASAPDGETPGPKARIGVQSAEAVPAALSMPSVSQKATTLPPFAASHPESTRDVSERTAGSHVSATT